MDFYFALEEFEAGGVEALQLDDLHCVAFESLICLHSLVDAATVAPSEHLIQKDLILAYFYPLVSLLDGTQTVILGTCAVTQWSG